MLEILLNILVVTLLGLTITFCLRLNKRIAELHSNRKELVNLVRALDNALLATHKSIKSLKEASNQSETNIHLSIEKAQELSNDLSFLNNIAEKLADRLDANTNKAKLILDLLSESKKSKKSNSPVPKKKAASSRKIQSKSPKVDHTVPNPDVLSQNKDVF